MHIFHKWTQWEDDVMRVYTFSQRTSVIASVQRRRCTKCGKVVTRTI